MLNKKILVVDDQQDMLFMMKAILIRYGFEVITDSTGDVINILEEGLEPDLIILDINLGDKDGGDICLALKQQQSTKHIPIILVSAVMDLLKISGECGAEDFLAKPFEAPQLINKIHNLVAA